MLVEIWQLQTFVASCMQRAAVPPLYWWCMLPQGRSTTQCFDQGQRDLQDHCSLWEKWGWCRNKKKILQLAESVLEEFEAQVASVGRKDAEHNFFCISIRHSLYGSSLIIWVLWLLITASSVFLHISCSPILVEYLWLSSTPSNFDLDKRLHVLGLVWSYLYVEKSAS